MPGSRGESRRWSGLYDGEMREVVTQEGFPRALCSPSRQCTSRQAPALMPLLISVFYPQRCWLTLTRQHLLSNCIQHPAHGFMGDLISSGNLAQGLPLSNAMQDSGPLSGRNFEEGNRRIDMLLLRKRGI